MKSKIFYIQLTFLCLCFLIPCLSHAQGPIFNDDVLDSPANAPVDGGLSLLIAVGVGYGTKKVRERRNKKN